MNEHLKQLACEAIDQHDYKLFRLNQDIWETPEVAYDEHQAHKALTSFLDEVGFQEIHRSYMLPTGFKAVHTNGGTPTVAVICEYDALPGIGHACGHNLIAEVGAGAGIGIKAVMEAAQKEGHSLGKLIVLGTPAEEGCGGKIDMINAHAFDGIDAVLMVHPWAYNNADTSGFLSRARLTVKYHGKASHAAGSPWDGINALDAAVMAYSSISVLRQQCKPSWRMHGVIVNGGARPNIIPELTEMDYYFRTPSLQELKDLKSKAIACFEGAATATGCTVEFQWNPKTYANLISNPSLVKLYKENMKVLDLDETDQGVPPAGSSDMGNVSQIIPSIHPFFGIGTQAANHTRQFTEAAGSQKAHECAIQQAKLLAMVAIDVMCQPLILPTMKEELTSANKS